MKRLALFLLFAGACYAQLFGSGSKWSDNGTAISPKNNRSVAIGTPLPPGVPPAKPYINVEGGVLVNGVAVGSGAGGASGKDYAAAGCQSAVGLATFSLPAVGAPTAACVTGTDSPATVKGVLQFTDDGATVLSAQDHFTLPGTMPTSIDFSGKWRSAVADNTKSVVWQIQTKCVGDGETVDAVAWNAAQAITDANKAVANQENDFSQTGLTITGCEGGKELYWYLFRDPAHASDTLGATAELISLRFKFN